MSECVTVRVTSHAVDRALEKFGLEPTEDQWHATVEAIVQGRSVLMHHHPSGCETHMVDLCGTAVKLVFDPHHLSVVTLLRQSEGNKLIRKVRGQRLKKRVTDIERRPNNRSWLAAE